MSLNNQRAQLAKWDQLADECRLRRLLTQEKARELADALTSAVALLRAGDSALIEPTPAERHAGAVDLSEPGFDAQVTVDLLSLVMCGPGPTVEAVRAWTPEQVSEAEAWAGACHLSASDHDDIEVPLRPLHTFAPTGLYCVECGQPQYQSPGGPVCVNGHGGVEGLTLEDITRKGRAS